jgi:long-chain acyl-CoA synthetase
MLSHGNLVSNIHQVLNSSSAMTADDVVYGVLPMFHIYGLNVVLGISLTVGATIVLVQRFDPSTALETIAHRHITVMPGAPPMWVSFSTFDDAPANAFASVRQAFTGAAKMPEEASRRLEARFGLRLAEGYGLPLDEALALGSPVLARNIAVFGRHITAHNLLTETQSIMSIFWIQKKHPSQKN